jgi:hypothetical protein
MKRKFDKNDIPDDVADLVNNADYFSESALDSKAIKEDISVIETLRGYFSENRLYWKGVAIELAKKIKKLDVLQETSAEIHSQKQIGLEFRYKLFEELSKLKAKMTKQRKLIFEKSRIDYEHVLKQKTDKDIYIDAGTADLQEQIDIFSNHIKYLDETLKNIDGMLWSIKDVLEYEKIKYGIR